MIRKLSEPWSEGLRTALGLPAEEGDPVVAFVGGAREVREALLRLQGNILIPV